MAFATSPQDAIDRRRTYVRMTDVNMPSGTKTSIVIPSKSQCNCTNVGDNLKLITLRQDGKMSGREYKIIYDEMTKTVNTNVNYTIKTIQKIQNCCLWSKFRAKEKQIHSEVGYVNERMLFHGSPTADQIVKTGFDLSKARGGLFGHGIYFAPNSSKSHGYTGGVSHKILMCRVALGKMQRLSSSQIVSLPPSHHSVEGNLTVTEYVIYNADQVYPEYIIYYN